MVGIRQYLRPDIAASAIVHLSIVALVFVYAEAHPFGSVPVQAVNVDIVTPDEIEKKPEPEPAPSPSPQLPADLRALTKPAETPAPPPRRAGREGPATAGGASGSQGGGSRAKARATGATVPAASRKPRPDPRRAAAEPGPGACAIAVIRLCAA